MSEEMATLDDGLACAEERLAAERAAELEERAKMVEQQLLVIAARLGILWSKVTGSGRPVPSVRDTADIGGDVVTVETHLRYEEGHLQALRGAPGRCGGAPEAGQGPPCRTGGGKAG